jgi:hypothetical protein
MVAAIATYLCAVVQVDQRRVSPGVNVASCFVPLESDAPFMALSDHRSRMQAGAVPKTHVSIDGGRNVNN